MLNRFLETKSEEESIYDQLLKQYETGYDDSDSDSDDSVVEKFDVHFVGEESKEHKADKQYHFLNIDDEDEFDFDFLKKDEQKLEKQVHVQQLDEEDELDLDAKEQKSDKPSLEDNSHFESHLAITLSKRKDLFPVVDKISQCIIYSIDKHRAVYNQYLRLKPIFEEVYYSLYSNDLGVLGDLYGKRISTDQILNDIKAALMDRNRALINIIPIQFIFMHRIFCHAAHDKHEQVYKDNKHFDRVDKYLRETKAHVFRDKEFNVRETDQLGLSRFPNVCKKINALPETKEIKKMLHLPMFKTSFERFTITPGDKLHKFYKHNAPLVAGPSTHTYGAIAAAKTFIPGLTPEELKEYACAYFVFTGCAGYHTFHEVMSIASKCNNRPYDMSNYYDNLPDNLKKSDFITELKKLFPQQLTPAAKTYTGKPDPSLFSADTEAPKKETPTRVRFVVEEKKETGPRRI